MKVKVDKYTVEQAIDYANREAKLHGFDEYDDDWKKAYEHHLRKAISTMSLGRNPRSKRINKNHRYEIKITFESSKPVHLIDSDLIQFENALDHFVETDDHYVSDILVLGSEKISLKKINKK